MIHRELLVEDLLQVGLDVSEAEVKTLQGLELVGDAGGEGANGDITNIAEEVLNADLLGFFGLDYGGCVDKCL
jgi:hypothetical protein